MFKKYLSKIATILLVTTSASVVVVISKVPQVIYNLLLNQTRTEVDKNLPNINKLKNTIQNFESSIINKNYKIQKLSTTQKGHNEIIYSTSEEIKKNKTTSSQLKNDLKHITHELKELQDNLSNVQVQKQTAIHKLQYIKQNLEIQKNNINKTSAIINKITEKKIEKEENIKKTEDNLHKTISEAQKKRMKMLELFNEISRIQDQIITPLRNELSEMIENNLINTPEYAKKRQKYETEMDIYDEKFNYLTIEKNKYVADSETTFSNNMEMTRELYETQEKVFLLEQELDNKNKKINELTEQDSLLKIDKKDSITLIKHTNELEKNNKHTINLNKKQQTKTQTQFKTNQKKLIENQKTLEDRQTKNKKINQKLHKTFTEQKALWNEIEILESEI